MLVGASVFFGTGIAQGWDRQDYLDAATPSVLEPHVPWRNPIFDPVPDARGYVPPTLTFSDGDDRAMATAMQRVTAAPLPGMGMVDLSAVFAVDEPGYVAQPPAFGYDGVNRWTYEGFTRTLSPKADVEDHVLLARARAFATEVLSAAGVDLRQVLFVDPRLTRVEPTGVVIEQQWVMIPRGFEYGQSRSPFDSPWEGVTSLGGTLRFEPFVPVAGQVREFASISLDAVDVKAAKKQAFKRQDLRTARTTFDAYLSEQMTTGESGVPAFPYPETYGFAMPVQACFIRNRNEACGDFSNTAEKQVLEPAWMFIGVDSALILPAHPDSTNIADRGTGLATRDADSASWLYVAGFTTWAAEQGL